MGESDAVGQAFVIGAQRSGTTSLAAALERHPQVSFAQPRRPEPKAFLVPGAADDVEGYVARFYADTPATRLRVEKSTSYLGEDLACRQIAAAFPHAQVVALLRDPVDRAVSHYRFSRASGVEELSLAEALTPEAEDRPWDRAAISVSPYHYLRRGRYADDLRRWFDAFPRPSIHVLVLEDLVAEPDRFGGLLTDLGLDPGLGAFTTDDWHNVGVGEVTLDPEDRARLAAWFADANADLAELLGRPLDRWTRP